MKKVYLIILLAILSVQLCAQTNGRSKTCSKVEAFYHSPIPDSIFALMQGKSFKTDCTITRSELRYVRVLHINAKGETLNGELVCHKDIADDLVEIFRELYHARYPIERIRLIDEYNADDNRSMEANNTSCFNFRRAVGSSRLSKHATGHAVDINPLYNPYVKKSSRGKTIIQPQKGSRYADRTKSFQYKIMRYDACYKAFTKRGFRWGGAWRSLKDWQHFEK